jgi:hypothetical protein
MVDSEGKILARLYPLDKSRNAEGVRRTIEAEPEAFIDVEPSNKLPPLLEKMIADFSATGLPAPYLPEQEVNHES